MNEFPSQPRRSLGKSDASDNLGEVPDGYSYTQEPPSDNRQTTSTFQPVTEPVITTDQPKAKSGGKTAGRALREILETVLLAAVIFFGVRLLVLNFQVEGSSMLPNLHNQELLLVNRNAYGEVDLNKWLNYLPLVEREGTWVVWEFDPPERGDIVVFDPPGSSDGKPYIKRVLALEGETVEVKNGSVYVNGTQVEEPYIQDGITDCYSDEACTWTVPEGNVWVMGDNRRNSSDSRAFGPVPVENIIGKAIITYWPVEDIGLVPHYDYPEISE
jgi:signal peptidase I